MSGKYSEFRQALRGKRPLLLDGAMGTEALARGLAPDRNIDALNLTNPDAVAAIHRAYIDAGADIISTNTFCSNRLSQRRYGLSEKAAPLNDAGARIALAEATRADRRVFVAGTIGPVTGAPHEIIINAMAEQAEVLVQAGMDLLLVETVMDVSVLDATLAGIDRVRREGADIPVIISMYVDSRTRKLPDGHKPDDIFVGSRHAAAFPDGQSLKGCGMPQSYRLDALGFNCGDNPGALLQTARAFAAVSPYPLIVYPGAGLPDAHGDYPTSPETFAHLFAPFIQEAHPAIIGACCGTTPAHIAALAKIL